MYTIKTEFLQDHAPTLLQRSIDFQHAFCISQRLWTLPFDYWSAEKYFLAGVTSDNLLQILQKDDSI